MGWWMHGWIDGWLEGVGLGELMNICMGDFNR